MAGAFLAGAFLAGAFFAGAFLAGAFFAGAAGFGAVVFSFGAGATPRAMSLKPLSAVIFATVLAFTLTCSPVAGLRAMRAGRFSAGEALALIPPVCAALQYKITSAICDICAVLSKPNGYDRIGAGRNGER